MIHGSYRLGAQPASSADYSPCRLGLLSLADCVIALLLHFYEYRLQVCNVACLFSYLISLVFPLRLFLGWCAQGAKCLWDDKWSFKALVAVVVVVIIIIL